MPVGPFSQKNPFKNILFFFAHPLPHSGFHGFDLPAKICVIPDRFIHLPLQPPVHLLHIPAVQQSGNPLRDIADIARLYPLGIVTHTYGRQIPDCHFLCIRNNPGINQRFKLYPVIKHLSICFCQKKGSLLKKHFSGILLRFQVLPCLLVLSGTDRFVIHRPPSFRQNSCVLHVSSINTASPSLPRSAFPV